MHKTCFCFTQNWCTQQTISSSTYARNSVSNNINEYNSCIWKSSLNTVLFCYFSHRNIYVIEDHIRFFVLIVLLLFLIFPRENKYSCQPSYIPTTDIRGEWVPYHIFLAVFIFFRHSWKSSVKDWSIWFSQVLNIELLASGILVNGFQGPGKGTHC